jgi:hypothetical protein
MLRGHLETFRRDTKCTLHQYKSYQLQSFLLAEESLFDILSNGIRGTRFLHFVSVPAVGETVGRRFFCSEEENNS